MGILYHIVYGTTAGSWFPWVMAVAALLAFILYRFRESIAPEDFPRPEANLNPRSTLATRQMHIMTRQRLFEVPQVALNRYNDNDVGKQLLFSEVTYIRALSLLLRVQRHVLMTERLKRVQASFRALHYVTRGLFKAHAEYLRALAKGEPLHTVAIDFQSEYCKYCAVLDLHEVNEQLLGPRADDDVRLFLDEVLKLYETEYSLLDLLLAPVRRIPQLIHYYERLLGADDVRTEHLCDVLTVVQQAAGGQWSREMFFLMGEFLRSPNLLKKGRRLIKQATSENAGQDEQQDTAEHTEEDEPSQEKIEKKKNERKNVVWLLNDMICMGVPLAHSPLYMFAESRTITRQDGDALDYDDADPSSTRVVFKGMQMYFATVQEKQEWVSQIKACVLTAPVAT